MKVILKISKRGNVNGSVLVSLLLILNITPFWSVSVVDLEEVNVCWISVLPIAAKKENRKVLIYVGFTLGESKSCLVLNFFSRKQAKVLTRF